MSADTVTETISQFIGMFEMTAEEARLRLEYETFRAERAAAREAATLDLAGPRLAAPHALEGYDPDLHYRDRGLPLRHEPSLNVHDPLRSSEPAPHSKAPEAAEDAPILPPASPASSMAASEAAPEAAPVLPPPASLAAVAIQRATLSDDDLLVQDGLPPGTFADGGAAGFADPEDLAAAVDALAALAQGLVPAAIEEEDLDQADWAAWAHRASEAAEAAPGPVQIAVVAGEDAAAKPVVDGAPADDMPALDDHRPAALREEDEEDAASPPAEVLAGLNTATNAAAVNSSWIDAGVIVVGGDVVRLDAISQINILYDRDSVPGGAAPPDAPSAAVNAAQIVKLPSAPAAGAGTGDGPAYAAIARIEGDLEQINWIDQYTYATDFDRAEVVVSGSSRRLGMGENAVFNAVTFGELGSRFDMIVVGGDMIDVSVVVQVNVLLDDDVVTAAGAPSGAGISTHDNLLWNEARITEVGQDAHAPLAAPFAGMLQDLASGATRVSEAVLESELFARLDLLRVLYIEGDLRLVDLVRQINVVGDADQIALAHGGVGIKVTAGSNQLVNSAHIKKLGVDSTIMARGEVYDDAFLHQAELIDAGAAPSGVGLAALASEAVAFLADDMIAPSPAEHGLVAHHGDAAAGGAPLDVIQSVLA